MKRRLFALVVGVASGAYAGMQVVHKIERHLNEDGETSRMLQWINEASELSVELTILANRTRYTEKYWIERMDKLISNIRSTDAGLDFVFSGGRTENRYAALRREFGSYYQALVEALKAQDGREIRDIAKRFANTCKLLGQYFVDYVDER